jgi:hypothetical protein
MASKTKDTPIPQSEHTKLTTLLTKSGAKPADLAVSIGASPNGKTRKQIADMLTTWLKSRPRG